MAELKKKQTELYLAHAAEMFTLRCNDMIQVLRMFPTPDLVELDEEVLQLN